MKAKTLLIAAATLAVGAISSQAQVYSQNVVGYINVTLTNGFNFVANQLDLDGSGTNNTIQSVIGTNLPPTTSKVLAWDVPSQTFKTVTLFASGWSAGTAGTVVKNALQPGGGVFIQVSSPTNFTIVGQVLPPSTNKTSYASQFQITSFRYPVAGFLTTNLNYAPNAPIGSSDDQVLQWSPSLQQFITHKKFAGSWSGGSPNLNVAEPFFFIPNQTTVWTNGFTY
jgi:hypothetical protein